MQGYPVLQGMWNTAAYDKRRYQNYTLPLVHEELQAALAAAKRNQLVLLHGCGPLQPKQAHSPLCYGPDNDCLSEFNFTLAAFLIVAGERTMFSYAANAADGSASGPGAWEFVSYGLHWWPEYDRPLGAPKGSAVRNAADRDVYTREFQHVSVWMNVRTRRGVIRWHGEPPSHKSDG